MKSLSHFKLQRIKKYNDAKTGFKTAKNEKYNHAKTDYGTYGLWGAILAEGKTVVSKSTFRYLNLFGK